MSRLMPSLRTFQWPAGVVLPRRLYAITDEHGCFDELALIIDYLLTKEGFTAEDLLVFLGDHIDRGPDSKRVLDLVIEFCKRFPNTVSLLGNHEDTFLGFLGFEAVSSGKSFLSFQSNGGYECLESYGLDPTLSPSDIKDALPWEHLAYLQKLYHVAHIGNFIFAHAGLNWSKSLEQQDADDAIRSIRYGVQQHGFGKTIIHGHHPQDDVYFYLPYVVNLDTGCAYSDRGGRLSCVEVTTNKVLQVVRGEPKVHVSFPLAERPRLSSPLDDTWVL